MSDIDAELAGIRASLTKATELLKSNPQGINQYGRGGGKGKGQASSSSSSDKADYQRRQAESRVLNDRARNNPRYKRHPEGWEPAPGKGSGTRTARDREADYRARQAQGRDQDQRRLRKDEVKMFQVLTYPEAIAKGGKPKPGTPPDKRLAENVRKELKDIDSALLEATELFKANPRGVNQHGGGKGTGKGEQPGEGGKSGMSQLPGHDKFAAAGFKLGGANYRAYEPGKPGVFRHEGPGGEKAARGALAASGYKPNRQIGATSYEFAHADGHKALLQQGRDGTTVTMKWKIPGAPAKPRMKPMTETERRLNTPLYD